MKTNKMTAKRLQELGVSFDTFGKNKSGNYVIRRGFFYRMGQTSEKFAQQLIDKVPNVKVINHGECWKPFRGGASVAQGSHFWVEFTVIEPASIDPELAQRLNADVDATLNESESK